MKPSRGVTLTASAILIVCLLTSAALLRVLDHMRHTGTQQEVLYLSSPRILKRLSLGYTGLLADIYWTRAVQYFGARHYAKANTYELLAPLLQITTELDPHLTVAYEFGANFLAPKPPDGAGMPQAAIHLANYGIRNNPQDWHLYYNLGFIYYMELQDYAHASEAFAKGADVPGAHPFLRIMAAEMAQHGGELRMAQMMWVTAYQSSGDEDVRANAVSHLRALQVDEDVNNLEGMVSLYRQHNGRLPSNFSDLQTAGLLKEIPVDPLGHTYSLMPDGRVQVRDPDNLPFITKGTPPGYTPPPPKFLPSD